MALFSKSLTEAQKELAEVQGSLQAVTEARDVAKAEIAILIGERDALATKAQEFEAKFGEASARITELETAKLVAENALATYKADFETKVENAAQTRVIELASAAGIKPVAQDPNAGAEQKTMTRAEFDKLEHPARSAFFRDGGKLTD